MAPTIVARFWSKVDRRDDDECWPWNGSTATRGGYGRFRIGNRLRRAHVIAYELFNGVKVPPGNVVRHSCDNPPCCNPRHLEIGSQGQNIQDSYARRRREAPPSVGEKNGNAMLSENDVVAILASTETNVALGRKYQVTHSTISAIRRGITWPHVKRE